MSIIDEEGLIDFGFARKASENELAQRKRITELEILLMDIKTDLLMRSEKDFDGMNVVNLSGSIWHNLKESIKQIS